ncbi:MAG: AsmA family protein [Alphaproteobacteria bacterium]|nr:AsmA family protein [Alphaproteobacteria bacterium]
MRVDPNDRLVVETTEEKKPKKRAKRPRRERRRKTGGAVRVLFGLLGLLILIAIGALVAPSFIDWNEYKDVITARIEKETGRRMVIDGNIALNLLPAPALAVEDVRLANLKGASAANMMTLKSLRVRVALAPLLQGEVQVESIALVEPVIELERLHDGRVNWAFGEPAPGVADDDASGPSLPPFKLDSFTIEDGTVVYQDTAAGTIEAIENLNAEISAASLTGPFKAKGTLSAREMPLAIDLQTGDVSGAGPVPISLSLQVPGSEATARFNGTLDMGADGPDLGGKFDGAGQSLDKLIVAVGGSATPALAQPFAVRGDISVGEDAFRLTDLTVEFGEDRGTGQIAVGFGETMVAEVALRLNTFDADSWVAVIADGQPADEEPAEASAALALPANISGAIDLSVGALRYNGGQFRDAKLIATLADATVTVSELSAAGPGDSKLRFAGRLATADGGPQYKGRLIASATNLRSITDWFEVPVTGVPANRLRSFALKTDIEGGTETVSLSDIELRVDATTITGGINAALGARPGIGVALNVDKINIDDYLVPTDDAAAAADDDDATGSEALTAFDANVKLNVGSLTYNKTAVRGLDLEARLADGAITVSKIAAKDVAGARAAFDGQIVGLPEAPQAKGRFNLEAQSLDGVARLAALDLPVAPKDLGPTSAAGNIDYAGDGVALDADISTAGGKWKISGTLANLGTSPTYDLGLDLSHPDLARLAALAALSLPPAVNDLGAVAVDGKVEGGTDKVALDVDISAGGGNTKVKGTVSGLTGTPAYDLAIATALPDATLPLSLAGIETTDASAALGAFGLDGTVKSLDGGVEMDLSAKLGKGGLDAKGRLTGIDTSPRYVGNLSARHPDLRALLAALSPGFESPAQDLGTLGLGLTADASAEVIDLSQLKGNLGPIDFDGAIEVVMTGPRPRVTGNLATGVIPLDLFAGGDDSADGGERWSREPFDFSALKTVDGELSLTPKGVVFGPYRIDEPTLLVTINNGTLSIPEFNGGLFGGRMTMVARLAQQSPVQTALNLTIRDANLARALKAQGQALLKRGVLDLDVNLSGAGISQFDLISSLDGTGRLHVGDGIVDGIDIAKVDRQLAGLNSGSGENLIAALQSTAGLVGLVGSAFVGGETAFSNLSGNFAVRDGVVTSDDVSLIANGGIGVATLTADLPRWVMNANARFNFASLPDVPVGVSMTGPIDNPQNSYETAALQKYMLERAGTGVGGLLQNIPGAGASTTGAGGLIQALPGAVSGESGGVGGLIQALPGVTGNTPAVGTGSGSGTGLGIGDIIQGTLPIAPPPTLAPEAPVTAVPETIIIEGDGSTSPGLPGSPSLLTPVPLTPAPAPAEPQTTTIVPAPAATPPPETQPQGTFGAIIDNVIRPAPLPAPEAQNAPGAAPGAPAPQPAPQGGGFSIESIIQNLGN